MDDLAISQRKRYLQYQKQQESNKLPKHIYKSGKKYTITKSIDGERKYFKTLNTLSEAISYRNQLIENNWQPLPLTEEELYEKNSKHYYRGLILSKNHRQYIINDSNGDYLGLCSTIEEALQYRDMYYHSTFKESPRPAILDLKENNHYLNGLEYDLPERLTPTHISDYGKGRILKKGEASYHIYHGGKRRNGKKEKRYFCACRTYEQAWYVWKELQKCNWDREKLPEILDNYPVWYTKLLKLYQYVHRDYNVENKWQVNVPREFLSPGKNLEKINNYTHVEDALFERDFLVEHDWNYDLLVEAIDDRENPYWDMELPPYPERKIRNIRNRNYHEKELTRIYEAIYNGEIENQLEACELVGTNEVSLRVWLKEYWDSDWREFKRISLTGENPINVMKKVTKIYQPDLSKPMPSNFNGWVHKNKSKKSPFMVRKGTTHYGSYPTEKMAKAVVKKLVACNWDKSKLEDIKKSVGYQKPPKRGNVYPNAKGYGWYIRHKDKGTRNNIYYGHYTDKRIADLTRDFLKINDWNKDMLPTLSDLAEYIIRWVDNIHNTMFNGNNNTINEYNIDYYEYIDDSHYLWINGKYQVIKYHEEKGVMQTYGIYDSEEEAKEIVEVLRLNNWDESVLTELKGVIF